MSVLAYLGPEGTFTHAAALAWPGHDLLPCASVHDVHAAVVDGRADRGVVAVENSVEGYVVPTLDTLLSSAEVVAVDETVLDVGFDAFVLPGADRAELVVATAHSHGLAQCAAFVARRGLAPVPASSNAAACRDLAPGQVALGPRLCGDLYGLETLEESVEDFRGARTRFLLLGRRREAVAAFAPASAGPAASGGDAAADAGPWRTMLAITPVVTGPGVLARITAAFGAGGVNLSSLITRPVKAQEGQYVFVVTVDAAPWDGGARSVLEDLLRAGDSLKTLGVYPARGELDEDVDLDHLPAGAVQAGSDAAALRDGLLWG
ncbi:prephenate dehydratase [Luteimicrobium subarcticum]|uniref:Prephenate dehydratase n=1 Tax=Luteimicrobium subarcticum TaxID=620910 RepID=A0A2M8WUL7_9MICO|nr:prephenate dehydratase domain-containing protein [Luteimicrobium subarcticum]PJI94632.1 prephenate dehydratase/chorismate mutase/prephenate dehydratase [Luteimicrobium subarcticum]